jgi:predicted permease
VSFPFWKKRQREADLDDELQCHLQMAAKERMERGEARGKAEQEARRELGNVGLIKDVTRQMWGLRWLADLSQDVRYGLRMLQRNPGFTTVAVLTLALGIGANTAIFSLIEATMLRILPVKDPQELVLVGNANDEQETNSFSYPQFKFMREHSRNSNMFAYAGLNLNLSGGEVTVSASGLAVSDNYFSVLGVRPRTGNGFVAGEESVAILSYRFWETRFGGDPGIAGKAVTVNGLPFTVIGVAPQSFFGTEVGVSPDIYVPLKMRDRLSPGRPILEANNNFWLTLMARLRPGMTSEQARAEAEVTYHQSNAEQTQGMPADSPLNRYFQSMHVSMTQGDRGISGLRDSFGRPLLILMIVVGLVLLIACANVSSLLLARATARQKEIGVRIALGAGRARLVRQLLTESMLLSVGGGLLGVLIAWWAAEGLVGVLGRAVLDVSPNTRVLGLALLVSVLTGLVFGAAPAIRATGADPSSSLRSESGWMATSRKWRFANFLVTGQVAISLFLLIGAGLFIRTLMNLRNLDMGFHGDHVLLVSLDPGLNRYDAERSESFYAEFLGSVRAMPGVESASIADQPLLGGAMFDGLVVEGRPSEAGQSLNVAVKSVTPKFFETMGIAMLSGRDFTERDNLGAPRVVIINERIARQLFNGQNPIGKHIGVGSATPDMEIIGVIADTKYRNVRSPAPRTAYLAMSQLRPAPTGRTIHVRTFGDPSLMVAAIRDQMRALDKNLPVTEIRKFAEVIDENLVQERLIANLSGFFGGLAVLLACMGLYGVMSYAVTRRTKEIGIRMALGASPIKVLGLILKESLGLVLAGILLGVPATYAAMRLVQKLLFGINTTDSLTIALATLLMITVATLAGFLPARRASRVDPIVALRQE